MIFNMFIFNPQRTKKLVSENWRYKHHLQAHNINPAELWNSRWSLDLPRRRMCDRERERESMEEKENECYERVESE